MKPLPPEGKKHAKLSAFCELCRDALILLAEFLEKYDVKTKSKMLEKMGEVLEKIVAKGLELTVLCMAKIKIL